jgi:SAM-dependent methyltransferase
MRLGTYYRWQLCDPLELWPRPDDAVLDIGCHDGFLLAHVQARLRVAVDLEPAQELYFPVWPADGKRLPFATGSFDQVYLLDVVEHVVDYTHLLGEAMRVLRPGGLLWLSTPSLNWWVFPPFMTPLLDRRWGHVRRGHTPADIAAALLGQSEVVRLVLWRMPYFRSLYFPARVLWPLRPLLAQRLIAWIARRDIQCTPGKTGHLFMLMRKLDDLAV